MDKIEVKRQDQLPAWRREEERRRAFATRASEGWEEGRGRQTDRELRQAIFACRETLDPPPPPPLPPPPPPPPPPCGWPIYCDLGSDSFIYDSIPESV